jgi:MFS family permease
MQGVELKRLFLIALISSLSGTALLAIGVLLFGSFGDTAGKILATTALLGAFSLLALPAGMLLDQRRAEALAWTSLFLAGLGLLGALVLVWEIVEDSDGAWRAVVGIATLALGAAQMSATTARLRPDDGFGTVRLYRASIGTGVAFVALVCVALALEIEDESYYRVLGAVAVLNLLIVLLQPFVRRLTHTRAREDVQAERYTLRLTLEGSPPVERRFEASDFARGVEQAIRTAEADGARVMKIERLEPADQG